MPRGERRMGNPGKSREKQRMEVDTVNKLGKNFAIPFLVSTMAFVV